MTVWMDLLAVLATAGVLRYLVDLVRWLLRRRQAREPLEVVDRNISVVSHARDELEADNARLRAEMTEKDARHAAELARRDQREAEYRAEIDRLEAKVREVLDELVALKLRHP